MKSTIDKLKQIVKCPGCNMDMTQHTLKYVHKRRGFFQAEKIPEQSTRTSTRTTKTNHNY